MTDYSQVNFFTDREVQDDPYPYFDWVREQGPVWQEPKYGVFMVTGHAEARDLYRDPATFPEHEEASGTYSSCNAVSGPFVKFSDPATGDDVTEFIKRYRHELPFSDQLPSFDPPNHTAHRHLLMRLITPRRLKENEDFMWSYADRLVDAFIADGSCELISQYAEPFTLTVIADLEGVPEADHSRFRDQLSTVSEANTHKPLEFLYDRFSEYIEERRAHPTDDVLSGLATATFPDGTTPEVKDAALIAANLFVGGQETTVRLLSFALRMLAERQDLQKQLRDDREKIPNFIEETLRLESPLRTQFRMARVPATLGGVHIPAGATMMLAPGACNRDPRTFENPGEFDLDRSNARQHVAFGHGIHTCAGAPLARAEGRVTLNRLLDRTSDISISEAHHGPADARRYEYLPTFFLRGLQKLYLELSPAA
ncbi:MAG: cytochrome P450 [Frankiaceae bacterium]|nr:cytochrome P450 [Frankiaceae bacterium]MBV9870007.1 cytochrome P450 [Frankiaceae bacterium]